MSLNMLPARKSRLKSIPKVRMAAVVMTVYLIFLLVPIYWLVNMSFKPNKFIHVISK